MNQDNKSTTPSETSRESVSFFQSVSRRHPKPGVERQDKKEKKKQKISNEDYKRTAQLLHATSEEGNMNYTT